MSSYAPLSTKDLDDDPLEAGQQSVPVESEPSDDSKLRFQFYFVAVVCAFLLVAFVIFALAYKPAPPVPSIGQMAKDLSGPVWTSMIATLPVWNASLQPQDVSDPRKSLIAVRNALDMFPFIFPNNSIPHVTDDFYDMLRDDVSKGYVSVGHYADLKGLNYTAAEAQSALNDILRWKTSFLQHVEQYNYSSYFLHTNASAFYKHKNGVLNELFWHDAVYPPSANMSGPVFIGTLMRNMLYRMTAAFQVITNYDQVWQEERMEHIHDYKKQLRAFRTILLWYPSLLRTMGAKRAVEAIGVLYERLDDTHGDFVDYTYYAERNNTAAAADMKQKLAHSWDVLRTWLLTNGWTTTLVNFQSDLVATEAQAIGRSWKPRTGVSLSVGDGPQFRRR